MLELWICFFAGMGAGLGTGFAGMSAAVVISPMLITFLGIPAYEAVGIALASDVLASAISAYTYGKNKNLDIRNGLIMMSSVLLFTFVGSYMSSLVPNSTMGGFSNIMTLLLGIKFIVKPVMTTKESMSMVSGKRRMIQSVLCGIVIGFICGFDQIEFAIALGYSLVVMYDAAGLRRATGKIAACLNKIRDDFYSQGQMSNERLKELLGHTPFEVFVGALLGILIAYINH